MGFFDGLKKGASDLLAVSQQVAGMTLDAGLAALNGVKTLITDPKKFVEDTAHSVSELGRHASNSFSDGAAMIGDGWSEAWAAGNPGMFLWKALGGTAQMASLGASDALKEHVERVSTVQRDELGNMTGFETGEDCDAITRILLERNGGWVASIVNGDEEVREALAEGDRDKANRMFGQTMDQALIKPAGKVATLAAVGVAVAGTTLVSGGLATPAAVAAASVSLGTAGWLADMKSNKSLVDFDIENAADDVKDKVEAEVATLKAGGLSDEDAALYSDIMTVYYQGVAYTGSGDQLGASQMGEGATNEDLKAWMLNAAGLDEKIAHATSVLKAQGQPYQVFAQPEPSVVSGRVDLAAAIDSMSAEDQAAVAAFVASRGQSGGLTAAVSEADPARISAEMPSAEMPRAEAGGGRVRDVSEPAVSSDSEPSLA